MFIFQTDGSSGKKSKKVVSDVTDFFIQRAPNSHLEFLSGGFDNSIKCMTHFLNGSGEALPLEFSEKEWKFIIDAANYSTADMLRGKPPSAEMKMTPEVKEVWEKPQRKELLMFESDLGLEAFKTILKKVGVPKNLLTSDVAIFSDVPIKLTKEDEKAISGLKNNGDTYNFKYAGKEYFVELNLDKLQMYAVGDFKEWLKAAGYDLDKMKKEMKNGEIREILVDRGSGKPPIPYVIYKQDEKNIFGENELGNLRVFVNRTWVKCPDGWERAFMVPGGVNSGFGKTEHETSDAWSVLGYTTVARRKHPNGYDYKVEETFDFKKSRNDCESSRYVSPFAGKVIKVLFPELVAAGEDLPGGKSAVAKNKTDKVRIDFGNLNKHGEPFEIRSLPFYADKNGNPISEKEAMAPPKQPAKVIR